MDMVNSFNRPIYNLRGLNREMGQWIPCIFCLWTTCGMCVCVLANVYMCMNLLSGNQLSQYPEWPACSVQLWYSPVYSFRTLPPINSGFLCFPEPPGRSWSLSLIVLSGYWPQQEEGVLFPIYPTSHIYHLPLLSLN